MKTLVILFIVLGIVFLYFVAGAEKSLIIKNDEVSPNGIIIPELITNKIQEIKSKGGVIGGNFGSPSGFMNDAINGVKDLASKAVNNIGDMIKSPISPIQNKIQEIICPAK